MMKHKLSYWERRQVQNMYGYMEKAEDIADQIAQLYLKASRYLSLCSDEVFEKYQKKYGLTEEDARRLLSQLNDTASLDELLEKLKNEDYDQSRKELLQVLEAPAYSARIDRFRQLQNQLNIVMVNIYQQEKVRNTSFYLDLANEAYYRGIFNIQQQTGVAFRFSVVDPKVIDQVINSKWSGKNYSTRIWDNTKALAKVLKEELLINLVTGRTNREASEIIANKFSVGANAARRLVRTESNYVSGEINFKAYEEAGIERYRFLATLDLRTSKVCRGLDGKIFEVSKRRVGVNCHPMHPWCRSTTVSVVDEKYIEKMQRIARDPVTGKNMHVPRSMNYEEWYEKYVKGRPEAELAEKMIKNRSSDRKQYEKYKNLLGEDYIPPSLDEFQKQKYESNDKHGILKAQAKGVYYYNKALRNEPEITRHVKNVADSTRMSMEGLKYRIKGKDSYLRKIASKYSPAGNEYEVKDIIRYTYTASSKDLAISTLKAIETHHKMGYNTIEIKNYWLDKRNPYNGINTTLRAPNGQAVEVQYHTPESYTVKDTMHELYEKWRVLDKTTPEAVNLRKQMHRMSSSMEIPKNIDEVK